MLMRGKALLLLVMLALLGPLSGCAATPSATVGAATPEPPEPRDPMALPAAMEALQLSHEQRLALVAQRDKLRRAFTPLGESGRAFLREVAGASRQCKGDSPFIGMAASRVIGSGQDFRESLLDGVDALHDILTPEQRAALSARLLDEDRKRDTRDEEGKRKPRDNSQLEALGARMDLSFVQLMKLLVRLTQVWDDFDDQVQPWRDHYREALRAFPREDFAAREMKVARAPAVKLIMASLRKGLRVSVPLLEPEQCRTLADIITERAERPAERPAPVAESVDEESVDEGSPDGSGDGFAPIYDE